ncbi:MAG: pyridoxal phosphate-dependent aminotransferase [Maritimibacter sp.]|uniref:MalY/PatB family protein n=1 Tax=Maritimibacter sp. TaxID=2003363 RepID=UPI001DE1DD50|nr:MalY/PatB family protein [Maritimibacter sp.]MBL6428176.1 pyridoxal phosphate-dependent aminotransferase [Maritimibacter sp.]
MSYDFDRIIDRVGTHSAKWDKMEAIYGVSPKDGIPMWVADMDFAAAPPIQKALEDMRSIGVYGYYGDDASYLGAIRWWMSERHGWDVDPNAIFTVHGLVNGTALCVDTFTDPGDGVILMTPVYHAFHRVIRAAGREVIECPLARNDGRYEMDSDAWDAQMTGREKMLVLCSPHNPGGRVWTRAELEGVAAFAKRHDLILVSDEIHHDLVFPGTKHTPMALIDGIADRLVMMTATTKTFNIAGTHSGNVIIHDPDLRKRFAAKMSGLGISPNSFGLMMAEAAYSPEGAAWVDALVAYLDGNRRILDEGLNAIPGLKSMPMEATYLAWVDFEGTGMEPTDYLRRVEQDAKIAVNHGISFGKGGERYLRFNFATPRPLVKQAVARMQDAFSDLQ